MSGIEVAGLALAVFPVLVNGLNQLIAGIETIHRWKRYRDRLKEYATKLESALAWFQDTLDELLGDIVPSDEEIKLMLREPGGKMWKRPEYEEKLRARLDRSYNSYQRSIEQLVRDIRVMSENLGVENGALVRWDDYSTVEREMKRLKVTFSKSRYKELLAGIWQANRDLREITHQNIVLEPMKRKRRSRRPISDLKVVRKHVASLHKVFMTERIWKCACRTKHIASLRLEARPQTVDEVIVDIPQKYTFHILLSEADDIHDVEAVSQWAELRVLPSLERQTDVEGSQRTSTFTCTETPNTKRSVRFATSDDTLRANTLQNATSSKTTSSLIQDFCNALYAPDLKDEEIGFLIDEEDQNHQHRIYRSEAFPGSKVSARSLSQILTDSQSLPPDECLLKRHRLQVAVILASSVLQLDGSPWLGSRFSTNDIYFHYKNGQIRGADYSHPYLSWQRCCNMERTSSTEQSRSSRHMIRSEVLLALGLALTELCFGRTLANMVKPEDADINDMATRTNTAIRLHGCIYQEMGTEYGDVVRRCLYQPFDVRELSLDIEEVQQRVLDDIVSPLVVSLNAFNECLNIR